MSIARTPTDVPLLRRELYAYATDGRMRQMYTEMCAAGLQALRPRGPADYAATVLTSAEADRLANAELFFVDEDLSDLLDAVWPSMPPFVPRPHDVPAPYGFVVFSRPLVAYTRQVEFPELPDTPDVRDAQKRLTEDGVRIVAASWGPFDRDGTWPQGGVWFTFWSESALNRGSDNWLLETASRILPPLLIDNEAAIAWPPDDTEHPELALSKDPGTTSMWVAMIMCAFQLAGQSNLAEITSERTPRPERRRTERAGLPARDVRVVRLRRHLREACDAGGSGREYRHRWVVRGHWRQQWYPKRGVHRPKWIAPYLKGPDDAPLLGGERVTVL